MPAPIKQRDGWLGASLAVNTALEAFPVPFTKFMKAWWSYSQEVRAAEALKPAVAQHVAAVSGGGIFDSNAMADLTAANEELTAAVRADTASDEAHHTSGIAIVLKKLTDCADTWDAEHRKGGGFFSGR